MTASSRTGLFACASFALLTASCDLGTAGTRTADGTQAGTPADERLAAEQDTLVQTLQTAMVLFNELATLEREVAGGPGLAVEGEVEPWDDRVRGQLERLRGRYADLSGELARSEARLRELQRSDRSLRASLARALRMTDSLQTENARMQLVIDNLTGKIGQLELENTTVTAQSEARSDSITRLVDEKNAAYWIAGSKDELERLGLIDVVGGRQMIFSRIGETFGPSRALKLEYMHAVDRRTTSVIKLPDNAAYEIVTPQNLRFADPSTLAPRGTRSYVRGELRIIDPEFWAHADILILVRR